MSATTKDWQTWKPEIDAYIQDEESAQPSTQLYEEIFNVQSTDRLQITEVGWSGVGPMVEVGELGDAVEDETVEGYGYSYVRKNFRKSVTFSSDLFETDQSNTVQTRAKDIVNAVPMSRNLEAFSMIRNAWSASFKYGDAKPLISVAHPLKDGSGTQANTFTDGIQLPLTYNNAISLLDVMDAMVSNSGNLLSIGSQGRNKVLFGAKTQKVKLFEIAGVDSDMQPDVNNNNANYFVKGDKFDVLIIDWIGYEAARLAGETTVAKSAAGNYWDKMWGIIDIELAKRYFKFFFAEGYAKYDDEIKKSNQAMIKYAYDKFAWGNSGFFPIVASKGDSTTVTL